MDDVAETFPGEVLPGFEAKKDGLSQLQDGCWKLTIKIHPNDIPQNLLNAAMGTRYLVALALADQKEFIGDDKDNPVFKDGYVDGSAPKELTPGEKAKRHFEATVADRDGEFAEWFTRNYAQMMPAEFTLRKAVKWHLEYESANDIVANPEPWSRLWNDFKYRDQLR